jgi:hypothetical protein
MKLTHLASRIRRVKIAKNYQQFCEITKALAVYLFDVCGCESIFLLMSMLFQAGSHDVIFPFDTNRVTFDPKVGYHVTNASRNTDNKSIRY